MLEVQKKQLASSYGQIRQLSAWAATKQTEFLSNATGVGSLLNGSSIALFGDIETCDANCCRK